MKITDMTTGVCLLSNIGDVSVAGTAVTGTAVSKADVMVFVNDGGSGCIFSETIYAADGTVWLGDVKSLLMPYMTIGGITSFTINVDNDTDYDIDVMYCTAELMLNTSESVETVLRNNFLVSSTKKTTLMSAQELLPFFCYYSQSKQLQFGIKAVYSLNGASPESIALTTSKSVGSYVEIPTVDVSPSVILDAIADEIEEDAVLINLYGYRVTLTSDDYTAEMIYHVEQHDDGRFLQLKYKNVWGVDETAIAHASDECERQYDIENAYISSKLKRIHSSMVKAHVATLPLATDGDQAVAEAIVSSPTVQVMTSVNSWRDITITGADQTSNSQLASENSIQLRWQWQTKDHKSVEMVNGTGLLVQNFNSTFDNTFQ